MIPRLVVAGASSGAGKTTLATGLMAALAARGVIVAPFKVGPDFIDPSYHALAAGRPGRNLDAFLSGPELIAPLFAHGASEADVAVVEGVMGLFDGARAGDELASTAHVAKLLGAPVVLVVDAQAVARSVAALVHGFATFDPDLRVAAVILNRVGSPGHEALLREALAPLGLPVLGALGRRDDVRTPERHLGLIPVAERAAAACREIAVLADAVARDCDVEGLMALAGTAGPAPATPWSPEPAEGPVARTRIAVGGGPAFSFRYPENLELLEAAGAELAELDPLRDVALPEGCAALYLGGGFPEEHAGALSDNVALRAEVAAFARAGRPVVGECGGLLYLARELDGHPMCGVLDAGATMGARLSLGYRDAEALVPSLLCPAGTQLRGHEFHYSTLAPEAGSPPAWRLRAHGRERSEGWVQGAVHASYLHTHWAATPEVARRLVAAAAEMAR